MAEIYALSETVRAARLVQWRCAEMNMNVSSPLVVQVDNEQARVFADGNCLQSQLRGVIDMRAEWVKELRDKQLVKVVHINTEKNKADLLTKCLPNYKFQKQLKAISHNQFHKDTIAFINYLKATEHS